MQWPGRTGGADSQGIAGEVPTRFRQVGRAKGGCFSAAVIVAEDQLFGGKVALKCIPRSQVAVFGTEREVLNHAKLRHPHIISLHEVFLTERLLVLVLEHASGGDLADLLASRGRCGLPELEACWIFQQVLFALAYCHQMGMACRDIKLENVLVTEYVAGAPVVKLCDFGLSLAVCDKGSATAHSHSLVGTPRFMAPEVLASAGGGQAYDARAADVWASGVLLCTLLAGRCPFHSPGGSRGLNLQQHMRALFQRILAADYTMPPGATPPCQDLIRSLLHPDPSQRPSAQAALLHPWFAIGAGPPSLTLLGINDQYVAASLLAQPPLEVLAEVCDLLQEAALGPATPPRPHPPAQCQPPMAQAAMGTSHVSQEGMLGRTSQASTQSSTPHASEASTLVPAGPLGRRA